MGVAVGWATAESLAEDGFGRSDDARDSYPSIASLDLTTPTGRAMAGMVAVFAEFDREILRERVWAGIAQARKVGRLDLQAPGVKHRRVPPCAAGHVDQPAQPDTIEETAMEGRLAGQPLRPVDQLIEDPGQLVEHVVHGDA